MAATAADVHAKIHEITQPGAFFELEDKHSCGEVFKAYKHANNNLIEIIQGARGHGEAEFIVYEDQRYSYTQFYAAVDAMAASLQKEFGVNKGDRVAIAMRNRWRRLQLESPMREEVSPKNKSAPCCSNSTTFLRMAPVDAVDILP